MEAGRELDALVAEKVMGWRKEYMFPAERVRGEDLPDRGALVWRESGQKSYKWLVEDRDCWIPEECPEDGFHPSTDIAAAWLVVERLAQEWDVEIYRFQSMAINSAYWVCKFGELVDYEPTYFAQALSAPHAICLAALKAVGVDV